jgi:hypothetical protein
MAFNLAALSLKTKLIAGASVAVVVGGGATGYAIYQSPDVVVGQAIGSLASGENPSFILDASATSETATGKATMEIDTAKNGSLMSLRIAGELLSQNVGATISVMSDKSGDAYVGLSDFDSLANFAVAAGYLPEDSVAAISDSLKNNWVKVTKDEISTLAGSNTCFTDKLNDVSYTTKAGKELGDVSRANFFLVPVKELAQEGSDRVFDVWFDAAKLKSFLKAVKGTALYKDIQTCNPGFEISDDSIAHITQKNLDDSKNGASLTLYADGFTHKLSKLVFATSADGGPKFEVSLKPNGDQSTKVKVPAKSITVTELMTALYGF